MSDHRSRRGRHGQSGRQKGRPPAKSWWGEQLPKCQICSRRLRIRRFFQALMRLGGYSYPVRQGEELIERRVRWLCGSCRQHAVALQSRAKMRAETTVGVEYPFVLQRLDTLYYAGRDENGAPSWDPSRRRAEPYLGQGLAQEEMERLRSDGHEVRIIQLYFAPPKGRRK